MAQSLSKIYVHLIFSTKGRERTLPDEVRPDLHAYMGGTFKGLGCSCPGGIAAVRLTAAHFSAPAHLS